LATPSGTSIFPRILDVEGLRETACECDETVNPHYEALLGISPKMN
jgi:hypothetical protein